MDNADVMLKQAYKTDALAFRTLALQRWPKPQTTKDSGLACLVVVVRHLLSCFPLRLRFAIAAIQDCSEALKGFLQDDAELSFTTLRRVFDQEKPMTFESLIEQPPMTSMLQSPPCFRLYSVDHEIPNRIPRESQTHPLELAATGIEWDGTGEESLTEHIRQYFEFISFDMDEIRVPNSPIMIRLKYTNKNPGRRSHSDLSSFSLRNIFPEVSAPSPQDIVRYYAVAVIKLRRSDNEVDSLRLYDEYGNPLEYSRHVDKTAAPWSDQWTIENDMEGQYVIYYIRNDSPIIPPSQPLVTASPPQRTALIQKSLQAFQASKKAQNPPQTSSNVTHSPAAQSQEQREQQRAGARSTSHPGLSHSDHDPDKDTNGTDQLQIFNKGYEQKQTSPHKGPTRPGKDEDLGHLAFSDDEDILASSDGDDTGVTVQRGLDVSHMSVLRQSLGEPTDIATPSNVEPRSRSSASNNLGGSGVVPHAENQIPNREQVPSSAQHQNPKKSQGVRHPQHQAQIVSRHVAQKPPHQQAAAPSTFPRTQPE